MKLERSDRQSGPRWSTTARILIVLAACGVAVACEPPNPILGRWVVDAAASPPGSAVGLERSGSAELEFLETRMVARSGSLDVTYTVEHDRVIVTTLRGEETTYAFSPDARDRMSVETPMGEIVFRRVPSDP